MLRKGHRESLEPRSHIVLNKIALSWWLLPILKQNPTMRCPLERINFYVSGRDLETRGSGNDKNNQILTSDSESRIVSMISHQDIDTDAEVVGSRVVESSTRSREAGNMRSRGHNAGCRRADEKPPIYISTRRRDSDSVLFAYDSTPFRSSTFLISSQSPQREPSYDEFLESVFPGV